jgi:hypothetical protein
MDDGQIHLKKTRAVLGEIDPIIVNRKGVIVDGRHRKKAYPKWRTEVQDLSDERVYAVRLVKNTQRRTATNTDYNEYAIFLHANFPGKDTYHVDSGETIVQRISKKTGIPERTIRLKLDDKYKGPQKAAVSATSLGTGTQVRVPTTLAVDVEAFMEEVRRTAEQNPKLSAAIIRYERTGFQRRKNDLVETRKMPTFLRDLVSTGKLTLEIAQLIYRQVPQNFRESEAEFIVQEKLTLGGAQSFITTQKPYYRAHKIRLKLEQASSKPIKEKAAYLPVLVPVKKLEFGGTVSSVGETLNVVVNRLPKSFTEINREINDVLVAIQKRAQVGDSFNLSINLLGRVKRRA